MVKVSGKLTRVATAFDEAAARARARTVFDESSGSDHSPEDMEDLMNLVESFMERQEKSMEISTADNLEESDSSEEIDDVIERLEGLRGGDRVHGAGERWRLAAEVEAACEIVGDKETCSSKRRHLMSFLRNKGFDAGLCKSQWEKFGKNPSGKYEYVDVKLGDGDGERYIVEMNIAGEFEIARPTERYLTVLAGVPRVFVGTPDELKHLVRIMCSEVRRSMKRVGFHVPPWRSNGYMQARWFGPYKRTVNETSGVKGCVCDCGCDFKRSIVGFFESAKTAAFYGCREEEYGREDGLNKTGWLAVAFQNYGVDM